MVLNSQRVEDFLRNFQNARMTPRAAAAAMGTNLMQRNWAFLVLADILSPEGRGFTLDFGRNVPPPSPRRSELKRLPLPDRLDALHSLWERAWGHKLFFRAG
jgi:hypothetical protein